MFDRLKFLVRLLLLGKSVLLLFRDWCILLLGRALLRLEPRSLVVEAWCLIDITFVNLVLVLLTGRCRLLIITHIFQIYILKLID